MQPVRPIFYISVMLLGIALSSGRASADAVNIINQTGVGGASVNLDFRGEVPLLNGFDFRYRGQGVDHHLKTLEIMPMLSKKSIGVGLSDKNRDDRFDFSLQAQLEPATGIIEDSAIGRCRGSCEMPLRQIPGYMFVLRGFTFRFVDDDHHIRRIGVLDRGSRLQIAMADKNGDDLFDYSIYYALVPISLVSGPSTETGQAIGYGQVDLPPGRVLIRGFMFQYTNGDHHLGAIAIRQDSDRKMTMVFHDQNADDSFKWTLQWVHRRY